MTSYLSSTRHPWSCLVFLLPLILAYEWGVFTLGGSRPESLRNGADAWLRWGLESFGFPHFYCAPALVLAVFLSASWFKWSDRPTDLLATWAGMILESILFAFILYLISREFAPIMRQLGFQLSVSDTPGRMTATKIVTFVGAGIYEEAIFRLGCFWILNSLFRLLGTPWPIYWILTTILSALGFAAAHHVGPFGEPYQHLVFCFRTCAGFYFGVVFQLRGFGIAVGSHAAYDVLVGVLLV